MDVRFPIGKLEVPDNVTLADIEAWLITTISLVEYVKTILLLRFLIFLRLLVYLTILQIIR
jgi:hypothetical protein